MIETMNLRMLRFLKHSVWLTGLVIGCQSAFGFALIGPVPANNPDDFEAPVIGYALGTLAGGNTSASTIALYPGDDPGTPKNINEGYRRNTPVMYYAFDPTFLKFFGPGGEAEVDKAMAMFNSVTNVSAYSQGLSEFPTESRRVNFRAAADSLLDIKSVTMGLMTEQLGFFQPVRWVWTLSGRTHIGTVPCPVGQVYTIIQRNFDIVPSAPDQYQSSSYVNDVLYSYEILEACTGPNPLADAAEFPVDPLASPFSAVADYDSFEYQGLVTGTFYTSLTRDDVGGLRYLIRSNNVALEPAGGRVIEFETNLQAAFITNQDLGLFAAQAATNTQAGLLALYPGLVITSSNQTFGLGITTNIIETLVNKPLDPAGFPPTHPVFSTNFVTNVITLNQFTFGNLVTNSFSTHGLVGSINLVLSNSPLSQVGTPPTVIPVTKFSIVPGVFGSFFILPTNDCSIQVLSNIFTQVIATTNLPATNLIVGPVGGTGATNPAIAFTPGTISFFTNQTVAFLPVTCPTNVVANRQGMERIILQRKDFDHLLNQIWDPVTNEYTSVELNTNSTPGAPTFITQHLQRTVPKPDFLFTTANMNGDTRTITFSNTVDNATETLTVTITGVGEVDAMRTVNFDQTARPANAAGPGTMVSPPVLSTLLVYNNSGPQVLNENLGVLPANASFIGQGTQTPLFAISWGSFDGSTNAPVVYPNGTSILQYEQALNGPFVTTTTLPTATVGVPYSAQLEATGGQAPYTWTLSPGSPGLPAGLNISADGQITGIPTGPGGGTIYDFSLRVTDSVNAVKDVSFTITVF